MLARAKLDGDCTEEHRKDDKYYKFRCGVRGCFSEITLNYNHRKAITLRGCTMHINNHMPRNIDKLVHCYENHDHVPFTMQFPNWEAAMRFIEEGKLDATFNKIKKYSTNTRLHRTWGCARKGHYDPKIDSKKNKGEY